MNVSILISAAGELTYVAEMSSLQPFTVKIPGGGSKMITNLSDARAMAARLLQRNSFGLLECWMKPLLAIKRPQSRTAYLPTFATRGSGYRSRTEPARGAIL